MWRFGYSYVIAQHPVEMAMGWKFPKARLPSIGRRKVYVDIDGEKFLLPLPKVNGFKDALSFQVKATAEMLKLRLAYEKWKKEHAGDKTYKVALKRAKTLIDAAAKAERDMADRISKLSDMIAAIDTLEKDAKAVENSGKSDQLDGIKKRIEALKGKTEVHIKMVGANTKTLEQSGNRLIQTLSIEPGL